MALSFIPFAFPGAPGVRCAFQTRDWGVSEGPYGGGNIAYTVGDDPLRVSANRLDLAASLELAESAELDQIHGDTLVFDPPPSPLERFVEPPAFPKGDGLATDKPGIGLIIKTADCQPIMLAHKSGKYIAALHAGWRGNRINFPGSGVAAFCVHYGLDPAEVIAVRGPSLGPDAAEFVNFEQEWGDEFLPWYNTATRRMDLWALTRHQLLAAGLKAENIHAIDLCTYARADLFHSFRRDNSKSGRQASCIWLAG